MPRIKGRITSITKGAKNKNFTVDDGKEKWFCETQSIMFIEVDDLIVFDCEDTRVGTRGALKGKSVHLLPKDPLNSAMAVEMSDSDDAVERCFGRVNYRKGPKAFQEMFALAAEQGISVAQYLYDNCEVMRGDQFAAWWLKHRCYRRLWLLGLKNKEHIEPYIDAQRCSVADLYHCLTKSPGPLWVPCVDIGLAIRLHKRFRLEYNELGVKMARIAHFIYTCSAGHLHTCVGRKSLLRAFPDFPSLESLIKNRYNIVAEKLGKGTYYYLPYNYKIETELAAKLSELLNSDREQPPDDKQLPDLSNDTNLDERQKRAIVEAVTKPLYGIFGGAGTGKTTITRYVVRHLISQGSNYMVCGPNGYLGSSSSRSTPIE